MNFATVAVAAHVHRQKKTCNWMTKVKMIIHCRIYAAPIKSRTPGVCGLVRGERRGRLLGQGRGCVAHNKHFSSTFQKPLTFDRIKKANAKSKQQFADLLPTFRSEVDWRDLSVSRRVHRVNLWTDLLVGQ